MRNCVLDDLKVKHEALLTRKNIQMETTNGIYCRYKYPVLTADHAPLIWRYDFNPVTNRFMEERIGVNAVMNSGAIKLDGKYYLMVRVEGMDRKSFFAIAESDSPVDRFRFWELPVLMPETEVPDTNMYDAVSYTHLTLPTIA